MDITVADVLTIIRARAAWCRAEGESDMRNIIHLIDGINRDISAGKSRQEIIDGLADDEDDDE